MTSDAFMARRSYRLRELFASFKALGNFHDGSLGGLQVNKLKSFRHSRAIC